MKNLDHIKNVYFLGIGGIGMSALARYFKFTGRNVAGYDRTSTALTNALQAEGIGTQNTYLFKEVYYNFFVQSERKFSIFPTNSKASRGSSIPSTSITSLPFARPAT